MTRKTFWMVWNPAGNSPSFRHETEHGAVFEATRLARMSPGQSFFVLEAVKMVTKSDVTVEELHPDAGELLF